MSSKTNRLLLTIVAFGLSSCGGKKESVEAVEDKSVPESVSPTTSEVISLGYRGVSSGWQENLEARDNFTVLDRVGASESQEISRQMAKVVPGTNWVSESLSARAERKVKKVLEGDLVHATAIGFEVHTLHDARSTEEKFSGRYLVSSSRPLGEARRVDSVRFFRELAALVSDSVEKGQVSVKTTGVSVAEDEFTTTMSISVGRELADRKEQWDLSWRCTWSRGKGSSLKLLEETARHRRSLPQSAGFADVSALVFAKTSSYQPQFLRGTADWATRVTRLGDFSLTGHQGIAVGDANGDGREDLYVCEGGSLPNRLYIQNEDGTVTDRSQEAGVDWLEDSRSALFVDLDNDGDQDLVVATIAMIVFVENDGSGVFSLRGGFPGARYPFSLSAADYDLDGDLDLYACVYSAGDEAGSRGFAATSPVPFHDANNGGRNVLLGNLGSFQFADVTNAVGLDQDNSRWSFAAAWEDYDRDGDADLYVANDFGRNCLYRNDGGKFSQVAADAGVEDRASGMSVAWGDVNRDGSSDLYVGNMFSAAGSRVSYQRQFAQGGSAGVVSDLQRMARGNTLFLGASNGSFEDVSVASGANLGRWAWSSALADINNDGWEDIVVSNGYLTGRRPDDL